MTGRRHHPRLSLSAIAAARPRAKGSVRLFPEALTPERLTAVWREVREDAGLPRLRIHDCRHTFASQGVMNGVGLTTVDKLLGHRRRETTAINAHLDDAALQDTAAQAAAVIARAMGCRCKPEAAATTARAGDDWNRDPLASHRANSMYRPALAADATHSAPSPAVTATDKQVQSHRRWALSNILLQKR